MRVEFHEADDALDTRLDESKIVESEEVLPGVVFDFNDQEQIVGVEVMRAKEQLPLGVLRRLQKYAVERQGEVA